MLNLGFIILNTVTSRSDKDFIDGATVINVTSAWS